MDRFPHPVRFWRRIRMKIGETIRQARIEAGFKSQTDLARAMNVSQNLVSRWERAEDVSTGTLRKLAQYIPLPPIRFPAAEAYSPVQAEHILGMLPEEMKAEVTAILSEPDGREALNEWLRLFAEAPREFRRDLKDLIVAARQWPE